MRLSVITDEISNDLDEALELCAELGVGTVELRSVGGVNVVDHTVASLEAIRAGLAARGIRVGAIASPFLKCDRGDPRRHAVLERSLAAAELLSAPIVRSFSFWREPRPIDAATELSVELRAAATRAAAAGLTLALENEHECNVGSAAELRAALDAAESPGLGALWDPANAAKLEPDAFAGSGGAELIRGRIVHVHVKDVDAHGRWVRVGDGLVDHAALLLLLRDSGYEGLLSVETHWRGGTPADSTRACVESLRSIAGGAGIELG